MMQERWRRGGAHVLGLVMKVSDCVSTDVFCFSLNRSLQNYTISAICYYKIRKMHIWINYN